MSISLVFAFLFFVGAIGGWIIEFLFRNLISHNGPEGKFFINPGYCKGPYLPVYGFGLSIMYAISYCTDTYFPQASKLVIVILIGLCMTLTEFIGGFVLLKVMNMRLWDYTHCRGNIMGIICPLFSAIWAVLGAVFYIFIYPIASGWLFWLSQHLVFSFFIGLFFGVFIVDVYESTRDALIVRKMAAENRIIIRYEELKAIVYKLMAEAGKRKGNFFNKVAENREQFREAIERNAAFFEDISKKFRNKK